MTSARPCSTVLAPLQKFACRCSGRGVHVVSVDHGELVNVDHLGLCRTFGNEGSHGLWRLDQSVVKHVLNIEAGVVHQVNKFGGIEEAIPQYIEGAGIQLKPFGHDRRPGIEAASHGGGPKPFAIDQNVECSISIGNFDHQLPAGAQGLARPSE